MVIRLSLSYADLQCFVAYSNTLIKVLNQRITKLKDVDKPQQIAYLSEIMKIQMKLAFKLFNWPLENRHKKIKSVSITYIQGYIFWLHYDHSPIQINDKIELITKHFLTR